MTPNQVEELLKPRYKVIADYPGNIFKVGHVVTEEEANEKFDFPHNFFPLYPNLFQKLPWYTDRKPEEMPGYVKCKNDCCVWDVHFQKDGIYKTSEVPTQGYDAFSYFLPATKSEYLDFISKQKSL